ncbi:MAG: alpha/beta fold hydrolase [Myxococcota bacterium]
MPYLTLKDENRIYYEVEGTGERTLVLVNGLIMTTAHWAAQQVFTEHYKVIRYDQRNQGRSTTDNKSHCVTYAADLVALLDHLETERATVCGLSYGSAVAKQFTLDYPQRCSSLILAAPMRHMDTPLSCIYSVWRALLTSGKLREFVEAVAVVSYARPWPQGVTASQEAGVERFLKYNSAERVLALLNSFEVLDLRTVSPYDWEAIAESVRKTGKALVVYEDAFSWGSGAEIAARIGDELFDDLDGPVRRLASTDTFVAYRPELEDFILPQTDDVYAAIESLARY